MPDMLPAVLRIAVPVLVLGASACARPADPAPSPQAVARSTPAPVAARAAREEAPAPSASARTYGKPPDAVLRERLEPLAYEVTQHAATEPPFSNRYWNNHDDGIYVDAVTGEPLFSSRDKFDSGTGWPSFTRPVDPARVVARPDTTLGMARTEVRSKSGDTHLGHVFDDGPAPTGLRYCINSASLRFVPAADLAKEGYEEYAAEFETPPP